jgi:predicted kinase
VGYDEERAAGGMSSYMECSAKLIFFCGKMAAGKSTLAREVAARKNAILLVQDELLACLYPDEITGIPEFIERSSRLRKALAPHICALLSKDISVVLDFPANTPAQRAWFRGIAESANVEHELHFIDAPDSLCKSRLRGRSEHLPPGTPWTSEAEFDAITSFFRAPGDEEEFTIIRYEH